MRIPALQITCVGSVSAWGKQFLTQLQAQGILSIQHEPNIQRLAKSLAPVSEPPVIFLENFPDSTVSIQTLIQTGQPFFLIWFGQAFTKEDLKFALENRVYYVLENLKSTDKRISLHLQKLTASREAHLRFEHIVRSLKSILLPPESDTETKPLVNEIRIAVSKLEKTGIQNEFLHNSPYSPWGRSEGTEEKLPFHTSQSFPDAILTVGDLERTGTLWVRGKGIKQEGKIDFIQGKIVSATAGDVVGHKALFRLFLWDEPRFLFMRKHPDECHTDEDLQIDLKHLCREGTLSRDRFESIRKEIPPLDICIALEPTRLDSNSVLDPVSFSTLASVVEFGKVSHILDFSPLADIELYEALIHLKKQNLIRVVAASKVAPKLSSAYYPVRK